MARLIALCVAVAMISSVIRLQRPELATAVSLASGVAVLAALIQGFRGQSQALEAVWRLFGQSDPEARGAVIRAAGIAVVAELGAQLCTDAGESAMAGRIALAARVAILGLCLPLLEGIADALGGILP